MPPGRKILTPDGVSYSDIQSCPIPEAVRGLLQLFLAEGRHGVDLGGAARGQVAREER